jgi:hypothetical protein
MGEKHPIVIASRKNNHLAYLKREILGILNYLGKCLQKSSKVGSINNPMISGNIYLHVLIRVKLSNQAKRKSSNKKKIVGVKGQVPPGTRITCIWFLIPILPSFVPTTVGSDAPTAMIAPCF